MRRGAGREEERWIRARPGSVDEIERGDGSGERTEAVAGRSRRTEAAARQTSRKTDQPQDRPAATQGSGIVSAAVFPVDEEVRR